MKFKSPHFYFFIIASLTLIFSALYYNSDKNVVLNFHDNYLVIANSIFGYVISLILFLIGLVYLFHQKLKIPLLKPLSLTHTILTIGLLLLGYLFSLFRNEDNFPLFDDSLDPLVFILIGLIIQPVLILNSLISTIKYSLKNKL